MIEAGGTVATAGRSDVDGSYWNGVVEGWEPTPLHRLWRAHSDAVNIELLSRWLPAARGRLLKTDLFDEAVADGLYPALAARYDQIVGIDVSVAAIRAASARYPELDARVGNVLALPFADGSLDAVVSNSTLDHFDSRAKLRDAVAELARAIRPNGRLIITLDNRANPVVALRTSVLFGALHRIGLVPYYVGATYGARGLARLLDSSGFEVVDTAAIMHCPPQLAAWLATRRHAVARWEQQAQCRYLRRVLRFEAMGSWPTRDLTGHFVGALAVRR
jgi:SAM-dependent methyltransferase